MKRQGGMLLLSAVQSTVQMTIIENERKQITNE